MTDSRHARPGITAALLGALGLALAGVAVAISPDILEGIFAKGEPGALEWGPSLFRALLLFHGVVLLGAGVFLWRKKGTAISSGSSSAIAPPRQTGTFLAVLCVLALALRLWHLDTDLWIDELLTLTDFLRLPLAEIAATFTSQNQHMLYSLLARASSVALTESAFSIRLPAVLFGVAGVWATFLLGRRIADTREGLLASALMTFSYHHVWFSQNARGYTGLLFFATLSTWLWMRATERGTTRTWALYGLSVWLGIWIHMTMIFVVAAHGLVYLAALTNVGQRARHWDVDRGLRWKAPVTWFFAATLSLQVYALALPEFLAVALHEVSLDSEWVNPLWVVRESLLRLADGGLSGVLVVGGMLVAAAGLLRIWKDDWRSAVLLSAPGLLGGGTMLALGHNLWPRFFFFCMAFALIIAVRGMTELPAVAFRALRLREADVWAGRVALVGGIAVIALSAYTIPRAYLPKQDFTGARAWVETAMQSGDAVVAVGLAGDAYYRLYAPDWPRIESQADLTTIEETHRSVWLIYTLPVHLEAWFPDIWQDIQREYETVRVFYGTLGGGDIVVTRRRGDS